MRIHSQDDGAAANAKVWINGVPSNGCVAADDDEGWVDEYVLDANQQPVVVNDDWTTQRRYGKVRIHWPGKTTDYMGAVREIAGSR